MSYLPMLAMAALGITMAVYSFNYANKKKKPHPSFLGKRNKISETEDEIDADGHWTMNPDYKFMCLTSLDYVKYICKQHNDCNDRLRFMEAVDRYLKVYTGRKLKTFSLGCCFLDDIRSHLEHWMQTIVGLDVEELLLYDPCSNYKPFNFCFQLISELSTLRKLILVRCNVEPGFLGQFNSLVTMTLHTVSLLKDEISEILLSCPNLERLCLEHCELPLKSRISGQNLKLKALALYCCYGLQELDISAVNLVDIHIDSCIGLELFLSSVPKLDILSFITHGKPICFGDVQTELPNLTTLLLQGTFKAVDEIPSVPPTFEMFGNIRILILLMKRHGYPGACREDDLCTFAPVLSACPLLRSFYLMVERSNCNEERGVEWPDLLHKHLEHMELIGFSNKKNELDFAKFILKSAQVLQRLVLRTSLIYCDRMRRFSDFPLDHCPEINEKEAQLISEYLGHALSSAVTVTIC